MRLSCRLKWYSHGLLKQDQLIRITKECPELSPQLQLSLAKDMQLKELSKCLSIGSIAKWILKMLMIKLFGHGRDEQGDSKRMMLLAKIGRLSALLASIYIVYRLLNSKLKKW